MAIAEPIILGATPSSGKGSKTITIKLAENSETSQKTITYTAKTASGKTATLTVVQAAYTYKLRVAKSLVVPASGGNYGFATKAGEVFLDKYDGNNLVSSEDMYGTSQSRTAVVTSSDNWFGADYSWFFDVESRSTVEGGARSGTVVLKVQDPNGGDMLSATATVIQEANVKSIYDIDIKSVVAYVPSSPTEASANSNLLAYKGSTCLNVKVIYKYSSNGISVVSTYQNPNFANELLASLFLDGLGSAYSFEAYNPFMTLDVSTPSSYSGWTDEVSVASVGAGGKAFTYKAKATKAEIRYDDGTFSKSFTFYRLCKTFALDLDGIGYPFAVDSDDSITVNAPRLTSGFVENLYSIVYAPDITFVGNSDEKYAEFNTAGDTSVPSEPFQLPSAYGVSILSKAAYRFSFTGSSIPASTDCSIWSVDDNDNSKIDKKLTVNVTVSSASDDWLYAPDFGSTTTMSVGDTKYFGVFKPYGSPGNVTKFVVPASDSYVEVYCRQTQTGTYTKVTSALSLELSKFAANFSIKYVVIKNPPATYTKNIMRPTTFNGNTLNLVAFNVTIQYVAETKTLVMKGGVFCIGNPESVVEYVNASDVTVTLTETGKSSHSISFGGAYDLSRTANGGMPIKMSDYSRVSGFYGALAASTYSIRAWGKAGDIFTLQNVPKSTLEVFSKNFAAQGDTIEWMFAKKAVAFSGTLYIDASNYISSGLIGVFAYTDKGNYYLINAAMYGSADVQNVLGDAPFLIEIDPNETVTEICFAVTSNSSLAEVDDITSYDDNPLVIPNNTEAAVTVYSAGESNGETSCVADGNDYIGFADTLYCGMDSMVVFSEMDEDDNYYYCM